MRVESLYRSAEHAFAKSPCDRVELVVGLGVRGDVHAGATVRHRSRVAADPDQPNLRQVHLIGRELLDALREEGFPVGPGRLGENVLTSGLDLLGLPVGTRLRLGERAVCELTGLRNPCVQLDPVGAGLMARLAQRGADGALVRKAGVMAVVVAGGDVEVGAAITVERPPPPTDHSTASREALH